MTKAETYKEFEKLFAMEDNNCAEMKIIKLLADFLDEYEFELFLLHVKEEYGAADS